MIVPTAERLKAARDTLARATKKQAKALRKLRYAQAIATELHRAYVEGRPVKLSVKVEGGHATIYYGESVGREVDITIPAPWNKIVQSVVVDLVREAGGGITEADVEIIKYDTAFWSSCGTLERSNNATRSQN